MVLAYDGAIAPCSQKDTKKSSILKRHQSFSQQFERQGRDEPSIFQIAQSIKG